MIQCSELKLWTLGLTNEAITTLAFWTLQHGAFISSASEENNTNTEEYNRGNNTNTEENNTWVFYSKRNLWSYTWGRLCKTTY